MPSLLLVGLAEPWISFASDWRIWLIAGLLPQASAKRTGFCLAHFHSTAGRRVLVNGSVRALLAMVRGFFWRGAKAYAANARVPAHSGIGIMQWDESIQNFACYLHGLGRRCEYALPFGSPGIWVKSQKGALAD